MQYYPPVQSAKMVRIFWFQWVLVTILGFLISLCLVEINVRPNVGAMSGAIGGAVIGLAQGMLLKPRVSIVGWVLASLVSWSLIGSSNLGAIGWVAPRTLNLGIRATFGVLDGSLVGALIGVGQWFILRQQVKKAWMWILTSALGWGVGLAIGWSVGGILRLKSHLFLSELVGLTLAWVVVAAITGVALVCFRKV